MASGPFRCMFTRFLYFLPIFVPFCLSHLNPFLHMQQCPYVKTVTYWGRSRRFLPLQYAKYDNR